MKNILHVVPCLANGGTEKYLINILKGTYKEYNNIILSYSSDNYWEKELHQMNIQVIQIEKPIKTGLLKNYKYIDEIIKKYNIDIIYSYTSYNSAIVLLAAIKNKIKKRIVHAHTSETEHKKTIGYYIYILLSKVIISILSTNKLACSNTAGRAVFYGKYKIINNAIDLKKYSYNEKIRDQYRKKLNIKEDTVVIGNVGRLDHNKNQEFLIQIFEEYHKKNKNSKLLLVGDGPQYNFIKELIINKKLEKEVLMLGQISNTNEIYNVFDLFIMTSFHEGLPFVVVETITNGLNIILSDTIDPVANINNNVKFVSLNESIDIWVNEIMKVQKNRKNNISFLEEKGYSLNSVIKTIKDIYNN